MDLFQAGNKVPFLQEDKSKFVPCGGSLLGSWMVEQIGVTRWAEELRVDIVPPQEDLLALLSIIIAIQVPCYSEYFLYDASLLFIPQYYAGTLRNVHFILNKIPQ